jgi:multiple sugar transport system permease protein
MLSFLLSSFIRNDHCWAVVLQQGPNAQPVTAGIMPVTSQFVAQYHPVSAGSIVVAIRHLARFFMMQRHFIAGLALGAVK